MSKKYLREFVDILRSFHSAGEMEEFLQAVLTPKELDEIPKRIQIVKLLKKGIPQREVTERLGVGIATVTRGSVALRTKGFKDLTFS